MPRDGNETRARIIKAASRLFYSVGIKAVSVDAVAEKAGITKKTLYYHFKSKDDLITEYLAMRDKPNLAIFATWLSGAEGELPDRVATMFRQLAITTIGQKRWRGCGFLRTAAELVDMPGHPAIKLASEHKKRLEGWLAGVIAEGGWRNPEMLARQISLLLDGAFSSALLHRDVAYVEAAGQAAAALLRASEKVGRAQV